MPTFEGPGRRTTRGTLAAFAASASRYHDALAASLGLNRSDVDCLNTLVLEGAIPAGRLAEVTGLTTGGVSGILDRLESGGFVVRSNDPGDRRRVLVSLAPAREERLRRDLWPIGDADPLTTETEAALGRLVTSASDALDERTRELRGHGQRDASSSAYGAVGIRLEDGAPRTLEFAGGAHQVQLRAVPGETFSARFDDERVRVTVDQAAIRIAGRRLTQRPAAEIELPSAMAWSLLVRGGANTIAADLDGIDLREAAFYGGMVRATLRLGAPSGVVPIRLTGGSGNLRLQVPPGAAVSVVSSGGLGDVDFLGRRASRLGRFAAATPGFDAAPNRYDIALKGGMTSLAVERSAA